MNTSTACSVIASTHRLQLSFAFSSWLPSSFCFLSIHSPDDLINSYICNPHLQTQDAKCTFQLLFFPDLGSMPPNLLKCCQLLKLNNIEQNSPSTLLKPAALSETPSSYLIAVLQFSSVTQSYPTLCDPMDCSMSGFPVHHQLPEFAQTHVH